MKIKLTNPEKFLSIVKLIKNIHNETNLFFTNEGISINVVDPSNIFLVQILIKKELFDEYEIETEIGFGIDFDILNKIISSMSKGFIMTDDSENLTFKGARMIRKLKKYTVSNEERKNLPKNHTSLFQFKISELMSSLKISTDVNDVTEIKKDEIIKIFTKNHYEEFEKEIEFENIGDERSQDIWFSGSYLLKLESLNKISDSITIGLDNDLPIYFNCKDEYIELNGWLAPRSNYDDET